MLEALILLLSTIFQGDLGTVPTVWCIIWFSFYYGMQFVVTKCIHI